MSLFRSAEHARRWATANDHTVGQIISLEQVWRLATLWYSDPRCTDWRHRSRDESQEVLTAAGLTGEFWELAR
jgi:Alkylmercury lyase